MPLRCYEADIHTLGFPLKKWDLGEGSLSVVASSPTAAKKAMREWCRKGDRAGKRYRLNRNTFTLNVRTDWFDDIEPGRVYKDTLMFPRR